LVDVVYSVGAVVDGKKLRKEIWKIILYG
jgi:hypothetical protein